ncbi:MAG: hypothetical protein GC179_22455 [Anaerolineaceae bacterium]|nr:hypothetical protein [Anaerolineaceae bacterium]
MQMIKSEFDVSMASKTKNVLARQLTTIQTTPTPLDNNRIELNSPSAEATSFVEQIGLISSAKPPDYWYDVGVSFISGLLSNLLSAVVLGIVIYYSISRRRQLKRINERRNRLLSMLKNEMEINLDRAKLCLRTIKPIEDIDSKPLWQKLRIGKFTDLSKDDARELRNHLPKGFTRGMWNSLKESGFFAEEEDGTLIYILFRANEKIYQADKTLRDFRASLSKLSDRIDMRAAEALKDCETTVKLLSQAIEIMDKMSLPPFSSHDLFDIDDNDDED